MQYDPAKDRSENYEWKKYAEERNPSDEEQLLWSKITVIFSCILASLVLIMEF